MKQIKIKLNKGQYMADVMDCLQSNSIYFKELPGIRATTMELDAARNSAILEPNVPVIRGKKTKGFFGVYEGIDTDDIVIYMSNKKIKYKKIMVTPESFHKVMKAAAILGIDIYKEYFLLFDECDRTMKDVAFREKILLPLEDFFKFDQKAFISATAVLPTDPRFIEHDFQKVLIAPTYDYRKEIELIPSNNVSLTLKNLIEANPGETFCVFLNSIRAITSLIEDLQLKEESRIFCSREKMYPLRSKGYRCDEQITTSFGILNGFTSRFNSAVDIMMDVQPIVVLATNLYFADHTMIDPRSEAIQIVGRFRNGVKKIYAVSNFSDSLNAKDPKQCISFLDGCEQSYNDIKLLRQSTNDEGAIQTLDEALNLVTYSNFMNKDGSKNHFMVDHFIYDQSVRMIFQSVDNFKNAYNNNYFNPRINSEFYQISDADYKIARNGISMKDLVISVVNTIKKAKASPALYLIDNRDIILREIQKCYPDIYEAFFILGEDELLKIAYSSKKIIAATNSKKLQEKKSNFNFIYDLDEMFPDDFEATSDIFKSMLLTAIDKNDLDLRPTIKLLEEYFDLGPRTTLKSSPDKKGYKVFRAKFNRKKIRQ